MTLRPQRRLRPLRPLRFLHCFAQRGIAPTALARLTCPIGLPEIPCKAPGIIAITIAAQRLRLSSPACPDVKSLIRPHAL